VAELKFEHYGLGIAKGMAVTLRYMLRRPSVTQYPEQKLNVSRRTRGQELVWDRQKCTGCCTCAKSCPQGVIEIVTSTNFENNKYEVEKYQVDTGYCIQCGLCVESCPYEALFFSTNYECAKYGRSELIQNKEDMMLESGNKQPSAYFYPELEAELPRQTLLVERITEED
jgi:formate hydrogenlyase subunit 6/NADH:ubiquinone oxidoreductase subunit I